MLRHLPRQRLFYLVYGLIEHLEIAMQSSVQQVLRGVRYVFGPTRKYHPPRRPLRIAGFGGRDGVARRARDCAEDRIESMA